jgi:hypothetical protein
MLGASSFRVYPLSSYAYHIPLYVIIAGKELYVLHLVLPMMHHYTSVYLGCSATIVLNNLHNAFLLGNNLFSKASL